MSIGSRLGQAIRERPVAAFIVITFAISYPLGITFNIVTSSIIKSGVIGLYAPRLVTVAGPALAATLVAASQGGVMRVSHLLRSCRVSVRHIWWLFIAVAAGVTFGVAAFVAAGVPVDKMTSLLTKRPAILLAHFAVHVLIIGLGEEIGWRGWLLPTLATRHSFRAATAMTGLVWGIWHAPVFFSGVVIALSFVVLLASLAVILAWLWRRSDGSVGVVAIAHGAANAPFVFLEVSVRQSVEGNALANNAFVYLSFFYALVAVLVVFADRRIWAVNELLGGAVSNGAGAG